MHPFPVADLHCDLLWYLSGPGTRNINDPPSNCSLPQLKTGNVIFQTLAIYTETGENSVASATKQFDIFQNLQESTSGSVKRIDKLHFPDASSLHVIAAIENASGICSETESLEAGLQRFANYISCNSPLLYISLTWHGENRFGGGNMTSVGLKRDGEILLEFLSGKKIAIDLSHTSDALAYDILNHIEKKNLSITPIASHSNFRTIAPHPRNLTDELAQEIVRRGGIIGLNFVKAFVGETLPDAFYLQIEHAKKLGLFSHLCLGADFFCEQDSVFAAQSSFFYSPFGNSSCYPAFFDFLQSRFSTKELLQLSHLNFSTFFDRIGVKQ